MGSKPAAALLLALLLPACAERWDRPGTTEEEADSWNRSCAARAEAEVPPLLVNRQVSPERLERERHCWREGQRERCVTRSRFIPARWAVVDLNGPARQQMRHACMAEQGFTFTGYRPLHLW